MFFNYQRALDIVREFPGKLNVISVERNRVIDKILCKNHLQIPIDDLDDDPLKKFSEEIKERGLISPEKKDVLSAINFSKKYKIDIVHCMAGISRSPAIIYSIFRSVGISKNNAMKMVFEINPYANPNKRIVRFADEIFD